MPKKSRKTIMLDNLLLELGYLMWYKIDQVNAPEKQVLNNYGRIMFDLRPWFTPKFMWQDLGTRFVTDLEHLIELKVKGNGDLARAISEEMKNIHAPFFSRGFTIEKEYVDTSSPFYELGNFLWHKIDNLSLKDTDSAHEYSRFCFYLIDSFDERLPAKNQGYGFMIKLYYWGFLKRGGMKKALEYGEIIKREYPEFFKKRDK